MEALLIPLLGLKLKQKDANGQDKGKEFRDIMEKVEKLEVRGYSKAANKLRGELFEGKWTDRKGEYEYNYFNYNPAKGQINCSLGVMLSSAPISDNIKKISGRASDTF